jgi:hypothetical protein
VLGFLPGIVFNLTNDPVSVVSNVFQALKG